MSSGSIVDPVQMSTFLLQQKILVGHNIIRYDIPVVEKLLGITITAKKIDTLSLSWYLYPNRIRHGLEIWGDELGVEKPVINDWKNLAVEEYIYRCEGDVKINSLLFNKMWKYLLIIYDGNETQIFNFISYLGFKLECAREQEEVKCKVDVELINKSLADLLVLQEEKVEALKATMPNDIKYETKSKPRKAYKKDQSLSKVGEKWYELLQELNLPEDYDQDIILVKSQEAGNPSSHIQIKNWLLSLGWIPRTFEYRKNKAGEVKQIPQVYVDSEVCPSIKELYSIEPALENLDMLSLINHRISIFEGYITAMDSKGYVTAGIAGFTNTLRFKHKKPIVNLPAVYKFYGKEVRGAIIAPSDEYILCGSDMSSLEDTTKQHYMYFYDPDYVMQMRVPGFDPHIDIGVLAKMLTKDDEIFFKWYNKTKKENKEHQFTTEEKERLAAITFTRSRAKTVNFAGVYGAGPPKIALTTGMPLEQAQKLHSIYWQRNKSVKQIAKDAVYKTIAIDGETQMWLYNPVSKFWYSLRYEKDIFSTLNQGTGVYCFDLWVREVRAKGIKIMLQYHDEIAFYILKKYEEKARIALKDAINIVNSKVKLNVPLDVSVDFGANYSEIH